MRATCTTNKICVAITTTAEHYKMERQPNLLTPLNGWNVNTKAALNAVRAKIELIKEDAHTIAKNQEVLYKIRPRSNGYYETNRYV